ncbi:MAG: lipopolysaccharide heptosyltransferase II [Bryobacterales bacterium]|nr:lipopolysaccharide heptosyltransferase II [Bryobacterales bacterium]
MESPHKLLIRATNWVGDAVMSLPALRMVRARFPQAHVAVLAKPWVADLYGRETWLNEVIPYTPQPGRGDWAAKWRAAREIGRMGFDAALLLPNSFESAAVAFAARIPERIGYARDGRGVLLTRALAVPKPGEIPAHETFYYLELVRRAGWLRELPATAHPVLEGLEAARSAGGVLLEEKGLGGGVLGVSPGAAFGTAKRWYPERFAAAALRVAEERGWGVALFGSGGERALCEQVRAALEGKVRGVHNFAGETTLRQFIDAAAACRAFLTNDSGAMHIAYAVGVPTVAVFGPTDHIGTGPSGEHTRIVRVPVECSPCKLRECPIDHRCMKGVEADMVARTALELLK